MKRVTVNTWPWSQKCLDCKHKGPLVDDEDGTFGSSAYICMIDKDAEDCEWPTLDE